MTRPTRRALGIGAAAASAAITVGTLAGCQFLAPVTPDTTPSPGSSVSASPSPTATSTESSMERTMRLDKAAAVAAYKTSRSELNKLALSGKSAPTKALEANATGGFLTSQVNDLKALITAGVRPDRPLLSSVTADRGWSADELGLTACEDASKVRLLTPDGEEKFKDRNRRLVQTLTATKVGGAWKISSVDTKFVKTFDHEAGCDS